MIQFFEWTPYYYYSVCVNVWRAFKIYVGHKKDMPKSNISTLYVEKLHFYTNLLPYYPIIKKN